MDADLLRASASGDSGAVRDLLRAGVEPAQYEEATGASCLMLAAASGAEGACEMLLRAGCPWNAIDRAGRCAGEYALEGGHQSIVDMIVTHAVQCEMLLGAVGRNERLRPPAAAAGAAGAAGESESANYLSRSVRYDGDRLLDEAEDAVMMAWESPLMQAHAQLLCAGEDGLQLGRRKVLNIGFGMGIIDGYIHERGTASHTIIEAHPAVAARARRDGWDAKAQLLEGRWQEVLGPSGAARALGPFDAIFYDAYAEDYADMRELHALLPELLAPGGLYSFFNGLCPDNLFFHGVVCQLVDLELQNLGMAVTFLPVPIDVAEDEWEGVARKYWHGRDTYYLPVAIMMPAVVAAPGAAGSVQPPPPLAEAQASDLRATAAADPAEADAPQRLPATDAPGSR